MTTGLHHAVGGKSDSAVQPCKGSSCPPLNPSACSVSVIDPDLRALFPPCSSVSSSISLHRNAGAGGDIIDTGCESQVLERSCCMRWHSGSRSMSHTLHRIVLEYISTGVTIVVESCLSQADV